MSKINQENYERYERLVETVNRFINTVKDGADGVSMSITAITEDVGTAAVYITLPDEAVISKPAMHELHKACFAADEMRMTAEPHQIILEVKDVFAVGYDEFGEDV